MPDSLSVLNASVTSLSTDEMRQYLSFDPLVSSRCEFPNSDSFKTISDELGGFSKPYQIPVAEDDTNPRVLSGFEGWDLVEDVALSPASVEILRPDLVAQEQNHALYLSRPLGLFMADVNSANPVASKISCAVTLPGSPKNFILKDNAILVFTNSLDGKSGGVLKYTIENGNLIYDSGVFLENKFIVDARLFNHTLAVYTQTFSDEDPEPIPYWYYQEPKNYSLTIIATNDKLLETSHDDFLYEEEKDDADVVSSWTRYNNFVSASDRYLVVSRSHNEMVLDHYEKRTYQECTAYRQVTKEVCHIEWEKVPNPDYVAQGSTVSCRGSLLECLQSKGPSLSRYIYVNKGTECEDVTYQVCTQTITKTDDYPIYRDDLSTRFTIYRFENDNFIRLDDTLSTVSTNKINITQNPVEIKGHVDDLSRLYFNEGFFYALSTENELNTFSLQGNSVIETNVLEGIGTDAERISASQFSPEKLFVNTTDNSNYYDVMDLSTLHAVNLTNPAIPVLDSDIALAGDLSQMFVLDNQLLAFGTTFYGAAESRQSMGTVNLFDLTGAEQDALLLGTDYQNYSSLADNDDQVVRVDESLKRIILPFTSSGFVDGLGYSYKDRLQIADVDGNQINDVATFELNTSAERALSFDENVAMSFSNYLINIFYKTDTWQSHALLDIHLPNTVYEAVVNEYWVRKTTVNDSYKMAITTPDDVFASTPLDEMSVPTATTHVCYGEELYFAGNGFFLVSEVPGLYATRDDCGEYADIKLQFRGWHVDNGKWVETDQATMKAQYDLIVADYQCVVDINSFEGKVLAVDTMPDNVTCYTMEEYNDIRYHWYD
ncbi:hypothetical protein K1X76_00280 [bacterium]|nr:hypothetical protein [bacterium]